MSSRSLVRPEGCAALHYSHESFALKGEDVVFVVDELQSQSPDPFAMGRWDMFCVCDGHGGPEAAEFVKSNLPRLLAAKLPKGQPPESDSVEGQAWLQEVRTATNAAFVQLDLDFREEGIIPTVGCTATIALLCGWILTVANVGDTEAFLDLGDGIPVELTVSHKIDTNLDEQIRLARCGKEVRPLSEEMFRPARSHEEGVGPLRVWPCGLAVSRAIGDYDCGCEVLASPHVTQVKVPFAGARLVVASDGLWDHLTSKRVAKRSRKHTIGETPSQLISKAKQTSAFGLADDTTVLVLDILPTHKVDFKEISRKLRGPRNVIAKWRRTIGKKAQGHPSVVLVKEDMAPVEPVPYASLKSVASAGSSKAIRPRDQAFMRNKTFAGVTRESSGSASPARSDSEKEAQVLSLDLDGQGPSSQGPSLTKFRSTTLDFF